MNISQHIEELPEDPLEKVLVAATALVDLFFADAFEHIAIAGNYTHKDVIQRFAVLLALVDIDESAANLAIYLHPSSLSETEDTWIEVRNYGIAIRKAAQDTLNEEHFKRCLNEAKESLQGSKYSFSQKDLHAIQETINNLRTQLTECKPLPEEHKRRLLAKLERLQMEIHKTMSNLDVIGGFIIEAGIILGKFGTSVKPLTDRVRELANAVWNAQTPQGALPESNPATMLPPGNGGGGEA